MSVSGSRGLFLPSIVVEPPPSHPRGKKPPLGLSIFQRAPEGFSLKGAFFRLFSLAILIRTQWNCRSPGVKKTETRLATEKDMSFSTFSWRSHRWGSLVVVGGVFCNVDDALLIDRRSIPSLSLSLLPSHAFFSSLTCWHTLR